MALDGLPQLRVQVATICRLVAALAVLGTLVPFTPATAQSKVALNPAPTFTKLSQPSITAGSPDTTLTFTGTGFFGKTTVTVAKLSLSPSAITSTSLTVVVPASLLQNVGYLPVVIMNPEPGGGSTGTNLAVTAATLPVPVVTSISPASINAGSPDTKVTLTGSGFVSGQTRIAFTGPAGPGVRSDNGVAVTSDKTATVTLPAAALVNPETLNVMVTNPSPGGGQATSSFVVAIVLHVSAATITTPSVASLTAPCPANITITATFRISNPVSQQFAVLWGFTSGASTAYSTTAQTVPAGNSSLTFSLSKSLLGPVGVLTPYAARAALVTGSGSDLVSTAELAGSLGNIWSLLHPVGLTNALTIDLTCPVQALPAKMGTVVVQ